MKHTLLIFAAAVVLLAGCNKTTKTDKDMNTLTFNEKQIDKPSVWAIGDPNTAYAQYFIGNSYLAPYDGGMVNVSFEPGCRNNWHTHHKQVQVLVCVYGRGWYQEWDKPAVKLEPGVIIEIPEGVKHWHGAAKDSWMQHLTYHANAKPGNSNEWLEPVTDDLQ